MDKIRSTLKQLVRDWSEEVRVIFFVPCVHIPLKYALVKKKQGREEREASYRPMREALLEHFSDIPMQERYVPPPASTAVL
jgi:carnosine N-methyltransferase